MTGPGRGPGPAIVIGIDDPAADDVAQLIATHLAFSRATTPADYSFALTGEKLADQTVTFFSARENGRLLAIGALKHLDDDHVELKSLHTRSDARGRGIARQLLDHLTGVAAERGYRRISLETGTTEDFVAARRLYEQAGFKPCPAFGPYSPSPYNTFMTRRLDGDPTGRRPT